MSSIPSDRHSHRLFETAFTHAPIGMALVGLDGAWLKVNPTLCALLGYDEDQLRNLTFQDITHPDDLDADLDHAAELLAGVRPSYEMEKRYVTRDGDELWVLLSVAIVRNEAGEPLHFVAQVVDLSERKRVERVLTARADEDGLSGVYNRRRFDEELERQLRRVNELGDRGALLLLDLDDFKAVNDRFGHAAGDALIAAVGRSLHERLRATDVVGRFGGDEFAIVLRDVTPRQAKAIADQLSRLLGGMHLTGAEDQRLTVSIGVTTLDEHVCTAADALALADAALYRAKAEGRGCVRTAVPVARA